MMRGVSLVAAAVVLAACASQPGEPAGAPVVDRTGGRAAAATPPPAPTPASKAASAAPAAPVVNAGEYVVKRGDTLYSIALEHGLDYRELAQWNSLDDPTRIRGGQVLRVRPPETGGVTVGRLAGSSRIEARPLDAPATAAAKSTAGAVTAPAPAAALVVPSGPLKFIWPTKGKVIAAFEQTRGKGLDIDGRVGDPIVAAAGGKVTYVGAGIRGLGKMLIIQHSDEFLTVYAHTSQIVVKEQQVVAPGQKIAEIGTSDAERPMLHFQIRKLGRPLDPKQFLPGV
jgi:lipoprotein NlpD